MKNTAIVLAGGSGERMNTSVKKQYLMLRDRPVIWYSLHAMQICPRIDEIVLVCAPGEIDYCRQKIVEKYEFNKVAKITEGGSDRCHSVYEGLKMAADSDFVLIHDAARPFIDQDMLNRILDTLSECPACVVGMPVKDTIKMSDAGGFIARTLPRDKLWMIQTPQSFSYLMIREAYEKLEQEGVPMEHLTDDAMVLEYSSDVRIKLIEGSYNNIKITTQEDLPLAETLAGQYI